jgi:hypothetical protein
LSADGDPATLGEIYAYGFRNAHRLSWDPADGTMFAFDIGMSNLEEDHDEGVAISGGFAYNGAIPHCAAKSSSATSTAVASSRPIRRR